MHDDRIPLCPGRRENAHPSAAVANPVLSPVDVSKQRVLCLLHRTLSSHRKAKHASNASLIHRATTFRAHCLSCYTHLVYLATQQQRRNVRKTDESEFNWEKFRTQFFFEHERSAVVVFGVVWYVCQERERECVRGAVDV